MKRIVTLLISGCAVCVLVGQFALSTAKAEGFALSDYGARGTALAGGMIGRADDPSAIAWNPAGITQLPGTRTMFGGTIVAPTGTVDTVENGITTSTDVEKNIWANPHAYLTHQYNDSLWFGVGIFSRFGLGNSYPDNWPGSRNLTSVSLQTVSLNPNVAYKVNENLSLAAGVEIMGASMRMTKDYDLRSLGYDQQLMKGKSVAFGFNLAAHYTFNEQWAAGFSYRSRVQQKVEGKSAFSREYAAIPGMLPQLKDSDLHGTLNLPDVLSFGVTWKPLDNLSFEAGTVYTVWSNFRSLNIYLEEPMNIAGYSPKNWKDTWAFNISTEYRVLDWLTLRGGYIYETSSMNLSTADYMTPSNGRHRITTGVGFNWDQWTLDLAYAYLFIKELNYDEAARIPTSGVKPGKGHNGRSHIAAMTVGYTF